MSIAAILKAGQLVKPKERRRVTFAIEAFDVKKREWSSLESLEILVETEKFSSGGFRDAFNPFSAMGDFTDFTLSNARRFYSSKGKNLAAKGLKTIS